MIHAGFTAINQLLPEAKYREKLLAMETTSTSKDAQPAAKLPKLKRKRVRASSGLERKSKPSDEETKVANYITYRPLFALCDKDEKGVSIKASRSEAVDPWHYENYKIARRLIELTLLLV